MPVQVRPTAPYLPPPGLVCTPGSFCTLPPPQSTPAPAKAPECARRGASLPAMCRLFVCQEVNRMGNPRYANGQLRRRHRARLRAMGGECGICHGRFGPIHYDEPSDAQHPLSFVVDEIKPVSRWREFGYPSARAAAEDWNNLQPAHWFCNAQTETNPGQTGRKRGNSGLIPMVSHATGGGGGRAPRPRPRRPLCRPAPIYTQEKFQRPGERGVRPWRP